MRPVTVESVVTQYFASMPTQGVVGNINAPRDTPEYWVGRYGNYQPFGHAGMDFKCPIGTPIYAMASGTVLYAGWGYNLPGTGPVRAWLLYATFPGKVTVIQHPWGIGVYAHQSEFRVSKGDRVFQGQIIGLTGNTGGVDPHLHVEALVDLSYRTGGGLIYGRTDPSRFFNNGLAAAGVITEQAEVEEDDMFTDQDRADLARTKQLLESFQAAITDPVTGYVGHAALATLRGGAATQYVKGDQDDTIYAREDNGVLRGIARPEWLVAEAAGEKFTEMPQEWVNDSPKAAS